MGVALGSYLADSRAQGRVPRIGVLANALSQPQIPAPIQALREALRALGYVEGRTIEITFRWTEGKTERLPELAAELVRERVDLIVAAGEGPTRAAMAATRSMPIVMAVSGDAVGGGLVAWQLVARAQQSAKIPRIGFLTAVPLAVIRRRTEAFQQGLRELGYLEGKNIVIEWRSAQGQRDRLPALVAELLRLKVDVIVSAGPSATRPAKDATTTIPIAMPQENDPVASGFVASLARPGGNITGLSTLSPELHGKQLELLKQTVPGLARVAVLRSSTDPGDAPALREMEPAARALGVQLQYLDVLGPGDLEAAFLAIGKGRAGAVLALPTFVLATHGKQLTDLGLKSRLPVMGFARRSVTEESLMYYGADTIDLTRRAATYVDKILKGARPADLPVEQPTKFELIINLKTARALGITIPQALLLRVDEMIQ